MTLELAWDLGLLLVVHRGTLEALWLCSQTGAVVWVAEVGSA